MISPTYLAPVLPMLLPFVAAASKPGSLIVRPDGQRLHLHRTAHQARRPSPACGQRSAGDWLPSTPAHDPRTLCRRCLPAGRAVRWACEVIEEHPDAVAQLLADAVLASTEARVAELQSIAVHAELTMRSVLGRVKAGHKIRLHQLIGDRRREFEFGVSLYGRPVYDVHLPEPEAV